MRPALIALALIYIALRTDAAEQHGWQNFYQPSVSSAPARAGYADDICLQHILEAQSRHGIPDNLLLAIGLQEAGRQVDGLLTVWPWTANAEGHGIFFDTKAELEAWVRQTQSRGVRSVDVGCMQVNQRWHAEHFASLTEATEPGANVDYAARFLRQLFAETRDWWEAAGRYHSATPALKNTYLSKLSRNHEIARSLEVRQVASPPDVPAQLGLNWTSDMTGGGAPTVHRVVSIYSNTPIRPLLPAYEEAE